MPADNRSIVITLKLENSSSGSDNVPNQADSSSATDTSSTESSNDSNGPAKSLAVYAVTQAVTTTAREFLTWGEYYVDRNLSLADDYVGQRNKNIALSQINRGVSAISNIASSTAAGAAMGGWIGAIVGFALGATTQAVGIIHSNIQGMEQQNIALKQIELELNFTRARAGWSTHAASIGEDL